MCDGDEQRTEFLMSQRTFGAGITLLDIWQGFGHNILSEVLVYDCVKPEAKIRNECNH